MKKSICLIGLALGLTLPAGASLYSFGTLNSQPALGPIPDNNTLGLTESFTASGLAGNISSLTLTFQLQGGAASDLSGYLRLGNTSGSPYYSLTSLIQGQTLSAGSPTTVTLDFNSVTYGSGFSTAFNGQNPNDVWTLFFADTVAGDTTTLNGWSLDIGTAAVPEPVNIALGVFGALAAGLGLVRVVQRKSAAVK
jgi:subtilisin-like proprotein convertase family protein